jgi:hypothetical protein
VRRGPGRRRNRQGAREYRRCGGDLRNRKTWGGVTPACAIPSLPPSTAIVAIAVALYYLSGALAGGVLRRGGAVGRGAGRPQM